MANVIQQNKKNSLKKINYNIERLGAGHGFKYDV